MAEINLSALMKQAQALQERFQEMQEEAASKTVTADSGGGMVRATVDGSMRVRSVEIDPSLISAGDRDMLQDLVVVAINEGLKRAQEMVTAEMGKFGPFAGLKLPGLGGD